jgi:hypothetical protein
VEGPGVGSGLGPGVGEGVGSGVGSTGSFVQPEKLTKLIPKRAIMRVLPIVLKKFFFMMFGF